MGDPLGKELNFKITDQKFDSSGVVLCFLLFSFTNMSLLRSDSNLDA